MFSPKQNLEILLEIVKNEEQYTAYGECRCCLAKGEHRDVTKEYYHKNTKEVYKDIFLECFNFSLSSHNGISPLICDDCVLRLRDANNFRRMLAATEAQLLNAIVVKSEPDTDTHFVSGTPEFKADIKKEIEPDHQDDEDTEVLNDIHSILETMPSTSHSDDDLQMADIKDDDDHSPDDELVIDDHVECVNDTGDNDDREDELVIDDHVECVNDTGDNDDHSLEDELVIDVEHVDDNGDNDDHSQEDELVIDVEHVDDNDINCSSVTRSATSAKDELSEIVEETKLWGRSSSPMQTEPKRTELQVYPQNDDLKKLKDKQSLTADETAKSVEICFNIPGLQKGPHTLEKEVLARNVTTIFEWSNASAFKPKVKNGYPCFYCREVFKPDDLRVHQEKHNKSNLFDRIRKYYNEITFVIYADITNLKCTICDKNIRNLSDLRDHLIVQHSKKFFASADRVIPFKLKESEFDCQVCGEMFETFNQVERHMNVHYGSFFCDNCGNGFITKHRLKLHNHSTKCHKARCQKEQKLIKCGLCAYTCRTMVELSIHRIKHRGGGPHQFVCPVCRRIYVNYRTMMKHLGKYHKKFKPATSAI